MQEVRDPLHQKVSVLQVGKEKGHPVPGADGQRTGEHAGAVCLFYNSHLERNRPPRALLPRDHPTATSER